MTMAEESKNQDAANTGNPTSAESTDTLTALKEEVARLTEENKTLSENLKKMEYDRNLYKTWWSEENDKCNAMIDVIKSLTELAKLG